MWVFDHTSPQELGVMPEKKCSSRAPIGMNIEGQFGDEKTFSPPLPGGLVSLLPERPCALDEIPWRFL
jgi:hypothetical protein